MCAALEKSFKVFAEARALKLKKLRY